MSLDWRCRAKWEESSHWSLNWRITSGRCELPFWHILFRMHKIDTLEWQDHFLGIAI